MEEKESTISGSSLGNSDDTDSPSTTAPLSSMVLPPQAQVMMIMDMNMSINNMTSSLERRLDTSATEIAAAKTERNAGEMISSATVIPAGSGGNGGGLDSLGKKKRGRPRKYDADGNLRIPAYPVMATSPPPGFTLSPSSPTELFSSSKRGRARPHGSGNWQILASLGN